MTPDQMIAFRELIEAAEADPDGWDSSQNARILKAAQDAYAAAQSTVTPLDLAWEEINALGGTWVKGDEVGREVNATVGDALKIIERLGGGDPAPKRAADVVVIESAPAEFAAWGPGRDEVKKLLDAFADRTAADLRAIMEKVNDDRT